MLNEMTTSAQVPTGEDMSCEEEVPAKKSSLIQWAEKELTIFNAKALENESEKDHMQEMITKDILAMVTLFSEQHHSGYSASYALKLLSRLLEWKPLTPLTGEDSEWHDVSDLSGYTLDQNNRCSAVFRENHDNATAYYLDGKVFSNNGGKVWWTNADSAIPITFPFAVPDKPEYILLPPESEEE